MGFITEIKGDFSRRSYDQRSLPPLYFTVNYTIDNAVLYLRGEEYPHYNWNYSRMIRYIKNGILSEYMISDPRHKIQMDLHERYRQFKATLGLNNADVANIIGSTPDSVKSATRPKGKLSMWLKLTLAVSEFLVKHSKQSYIEGYYDAKKGLSEDEMRVKLDEMKFKIKKNES